MTDVVLTLKQIKRLLALCKAREEHPDRNIVVGAPKGFEKAFKSQANFRGWLGYHVTWEVSVTDPWKIVLREGSLEEEWHNELREVVPELPIIDPQIEE